MAHADSPRINIAVADMHRITDRILDVSNELNNTNFSIHERVCVIPPTYYLDCFEKYHPNVPLNLDEYPFCLQCMNVIQEKKTIRTIMGYTT